MKFLHYEVKVGPAEMIAVHVDREANVLLLDPLNFARYKQGKSHEPSGSARAAGRSLFSPPFHGTWHVVVDMEGNVGTVRAYVDVLRT